MRSKTPGKAVKIERWKAPLVREETSLGTAFHYIAVLNLLKGNAPQLVHQFNKIFVTNLGYFVHKEVKTPLDLALGLAQAEQNMFGSKMAVRDNGSSVSLIYKRIREWEHVVQYGQLSQEDHVAMSSAFLEAMQEIGRLFGFTAEIAFTKTSMIVTFSQPAVE